MMGRTIREVGGVLLASVEAASAGFAIGTVAHYLAGSRVFGLSWGALGLAVFVGGIPGTVIGLFVGLLVFYAILQGRATWRDWAVILGFALVSAMIAFLRFGVMTMAITPIVTVAAAFAIRVRRY